MGNKVWVVQPLSDGSCRVFEVNTLPDGTFTVSKPWLHWTAMLLFGDPAYSDPEYSLRPATEHYADIETHVAALRRAR